MMKRLKRIYSKILTQFFPNRCPFCLRIIDNDDYACKRCKKSFPYITIRQGVQGCYRCISTLPYHGKFKRAVLAFKFKNKIYYSKNLSKLLAIHIKRNCEDMIFDYITYVPMHKKALKKRGYNQCELLAKELSKELRIPYKETLIKVKHTKPQHNLSAKSRRNNLKGAFKVIDKNLVQDKSILLIDDIITTGTTLGECAKTLQKANPSYIHCATILSKCRLY